MDGLRGDDGRVGAEQERDKRVRVGADISSALLMLYVPECTSAQQSVLDVSVTRWSIRRMKTKRGSCNRESRHIWFNVELAKKHPDCLEYIAVHEMTHYLERNHGQRFTTLMDGFIPDWRARRDQLNASPLAHEEWIA